MFTNDNFEQNAPSLYPQTSSVRGGLQHKSLVESIVEEIESRIISGELAPGQRLTEQALCDTLNVSRSPLREAFRILENRGCLTANARRGVVVSPLSYKDAVDVYTIRANLESLAVNLAIQNDDGSLADRLEEVYAVMLRNAAESDADAYAKNNQKFHQILLNACKNDRLIAMLDIFVKQTTRYRALVLSSTGKLKESVKNHAVLIESIRKGNASQAEKIRKRSILDNLKYFKGVLDEI